VAFTLPPNVFHFKFAQNKTREIHNKLYIYICRTSVRSVSPRRHTRPN